jgi:hypothetical protein
MKWCCKVFQGWFEEAGKRGLGVFVSTRGDSEPAFILQYRALDPGVPLPRTESPLSSISDVHIHFCPWCGANLGRVYRDNFRELDRSELQLSP